MYSLAITCIVASCGKDGDPGPAGPQGDKGEMGPEGSDKKVGYFEGTITGKRTDGTPINETFKYEYRSERSSENFVSKGLSKYITFYRYSKAGSSSMEMDLKTDGASLVAQSNSYSSYFRFEKEISTTQKLFIEARPYHIDLTGYKTELNEDLNSQTYDFSNGSNPFNSQSRAIHYAEEIIDGIQVYRFRAFLLDGSYNVYYRVDNGRLLRINKAFGNESAADVKLFDIYNKLKFVNDANAGMPVFYDVSTNKSLAEIIPDTPGDQFTITNYKVDSATGIISFDYVLKISGYRSSLNGINTTKNDLTITGKFTSGDKVYEQVGRVGS